MRRFPLPYSFASRGQRGRRCGRRLAVAAFLIAAVACAGEDLKSELGRARSWTATTALAADRRAAGSIDRAVTVQLADRATEARSQSQQSLGRLATTDSERVAARAVLDSLQDGIVRLRRMVR